MNLGPTSDRYLQVNDLYELRFTSAAVISQDGNRVAYVTMQPTEAKNRSQYCLWVTSTANSASARHLQVSQDELQDPSPTWSPCGRYLAFVSRCGATTQICKFDSENGCISQVTESKYGASAPLWSPDGTRIAFTSAVPSQPEPHHPVTFINPDNRPKVITRSRYKFNGLGWLRRERNQIFVIQASSERKPARQLTHEPTGISHPMWVAERGTSIGGPAWSPDGTKIAYTTASDADEQQDGRCDVWTIDIESGNRTRITPNDGLYGCPAWSPDGDRLAVIGSRLPKRGGANVQLWIVDACGRDLRPAMSTDISVGSALLGDSGVGTRAQPEWRGDYIYFTAGQQGAVQLWRTNVSIGTPQPVTSNQHAIGGWTIDGPGKCMAYTASSPTSPGEVRVQGLDSESESQLIANPNSHHLANFNLSEPEEFWTAAPEGSDFPVHGWILKPPAFDPANKYPLVLAIHGGPNAAYGSTWIHEFQCYAAQGFVVVYCNPRGSSGYGEGFATSIYKDWATGPTVDVMAALDHAINTVPIDSNRMYVTGGSYGGYLVNWIVTQTDRFRAAVTGRCVSDLRTLALASDNGTYWMTEYFGGMPWEEPDVYEFGSPVTHVASCTTPLLIEHQEQDMRCTMDQAEQMYNALRFLGVECELVIYPRASHGMSRTGQPRQRVDRLVRILSWIQRHF